MAPKTSEESSATTFVILNENAADVDVSLPGGSTDTIPSKKSKTYASRGSYTVTQTGASTSHYFYVTFPGDGTLSIKPGACNGDFKVTTQL
ncbi:hypothetical protein M378DRAFT_170756, partial [Amanita muscaria Koide BX008]